MFRKNKKTYKKSLQKRLFMLVNLSMFAVILISVLLNSLVFKDYYMAKKTDLIYNQLGKINFLLNENLAEETLRLEMEKICVNNNMHIVAYDSGRRLIYTSMPENAFRFNLSSTFGVFLDREKGSLFLDERNHPQILRQGKNYIITLTNLRTLNSQAIELYSLTEKNNFVFIQTSVAPISESVAFSNRFLIITGLLIWLLSALIVTLLSRKLLSPLQKLTDIAKNMANMDFGQKYQGKTFDEVGSLGDSMNKMSEALEKTIADLKSANTILLSDIDKKEKIDKQRKAFLSNVSHELKTPISIIEAYAEGLCEMELSEEDTAYYCEVILDETRKMNALIKKLMSLMRLESGSTVLDITRFDVAEQIEEIVKQKSILLEQNGVSFSFENEKPVFVWADEFLMEDVFLNYLTNAIKYCSGKKEVKVFIEREEDIVRVNVFNTGENIPEDTLEDIWKSFYTADKARTRDNESTGLGLSIVSAIMSAHNQKYGVYNTEGGVVFFFELDGKNE